MENHFYLIRWAPLSVTIFITHVGMLRVIVLDLKHFWKIIFLIDSTQEALVIPQTWISQFSQVSSFFSTIYHVWPQTHTNQEGRIGNKLSSTVYWYQTVPSLFTWNTECTESPKYTLSKDAKSEVGSTVAQ